MRIKIQQFLFGKNHSWSVCGKNLGRSFIKKGHDVEFISTDGFDEKFIEEDLKPYVRDNPTGKYDLQLSYTAMKNFPVFLNEKWGGKRFGIWNYEFDCLPSGFAKYATTVDMFLPSSKFFYDICVKNKISESNMKVIPHGVDWEHFDNAKPMTLNTNKKIKILMNIAQPHIRKNIKGTLEAFGKAFTSKDDVCLVIKVVDKKPESQFEVSFQDEFRKFKNKFPNHGECLVLKDYIKDIAPLYKSCDIFFMLPCAEAFHLPSAEALGSGCVVFSSNYGGQLDFLNNNNSYLINGKMVKAKGQYWTSSPYSAMFEANTDEAAEKLKYVVGNIDLVKNSLEKPGDSLKNHFSWDNAVDMILEMY